MTMIRSVIALAVAIGLLAMPLAAKAQPTGKVYRIGILTPFSLSASRRDTPSQAFFDELRQLGRIEGQNFVLEWPDSEGKIERMPQLAAELVRRQVDLIVASTTAAALASQAATKTIPIVFGLVPDPVGQELVESLARPGGNITGLSHPALERHPKLLQLLAEAVPRARKVAYLWNPANPPASKSLI